MLRKKLNKTALETDTNRPQNKRSKVGKNNEKSDQAESKYFVSKVEIVSEMPMLTVNEQVLRIAKKLNTVLKQFAFSKPVHYCYNPTEYALKPYEVYINRFCTSPKDVIFIGMNPGPFGMCQTGVPFGEITHVRDWMKINEDIDKPEIECPTRPIQGFSCTKSEQSGLRFWSLFKSMCETPERFFKHAFVYNYCPLAFMGNTGKNITPNMIKVHNFSKFISFHFEPRYRVVYLINCTCKTDKFQKLKYFRFL